MTGPFDAFLVRCAEDCINSELGESRGVPRMLATNEGPSARTAAPHKPTAAAAPSRSGVCWLCDGAGRVEVHVCITERECQARCPMIEPCFACLGSGVRS